jgi:hypothetical protein
VEAGEDGKKLVREDYRADAWSDELGRGALAVWQMEYADPKAAEAEQAEEQTPLRKLFYEAQEGEERDEAALAYLAAQLLRRQKAFRLLKEFEDGDDGAQVALFVDRVDGRMAEIRDPGLSYEELRAAQERLTARLAELEGPVEAAPAGGRSEEHG